MGGFEMHLADAGFFSVAGLRGSATTGLMLAATLVASICRG
jgi:hypothetical protein